MILVKATIKRLRKFRGIFKVSRISCLYIDVPTLLRWLVLMIPIMHASCEDDKKCTFAYIFMMNEGAVSWKSVKQTLTTSSIVKAEYVACYEATCHAI